MKNLTNVAIEKNPTILVGVQPLTDDVIVDLFMDYTPSTTIHLEYVVDERKSRQRNKKHVLQKHVKITHYYLNHDYGNKVRNLTGDADFQALALLGRERVSSTFVRGIKSQELMIDGKVLNFQTVTLLNYLHNDKPISQAEAISEDLFTPAYYSETEKTTSGRGSVSVDDDFQMLTLGIKNIKYLKCFGVEYRRQ